MATAGSFRQRFAPCVGLLVLQALAPCRAQDSEAVLSLVHEAVEVLHTQAYRTEPRAVICTKALRGLIAQLGENARSADRDLSTMLDDAAEAEFVRLLEGLASAPGQRMSLRELAERAIQAWCRQHDPYTKYVRSDDLKLVQLLSKTTGSGIGMSILDKNDAFYCYPLPGSPAEAAGIKPGDKLLSVDGRAVDDKPLDYLAAIIRGAPGSEVSLRLERISGRAQTLKVTRETLTTPSVLAEKKLTGLILRVRKFTEKTPEEARAALAQLTPGATLTIDLRGCPGGTLEHGIEFAGMFLEKDEPIVTVRTRGKPDDVIRDTQPREFKPAAIICLQDEGTASAAELVIAALVHSPAARAASQGTKSYGKGVIQTRIALRGGGSLAVTTGELIAPQGKGWDGIGLLPSLENRGRIFPRD